MMELAHNSFSLTVFSLSIVLIIAVVDCASLEPSREKIVMQVSGISPAEEAQLADKIADERRKVRQWWGATFEDEVHVDVRQVHRIPMALIPAWQGQRGLMKHPVKRVLQRGTLHELVHIYAPNGNRFLAEGLAVYAQHAFGNHPAYPNFGESLHQMAWRYWRDADIVALDHIHTPKRLQLQDRLDGRAAYIVAGSYVGYLIEQYGMPKFRQLYDITPLVPGDPSAGGHTARWANVYGISLDELATGWRNYLHAQP